MSGVNIYQLAKEDSGRLEKAWEETLACLSEEEKDKAQRFFDDVRFLGT